MYVDPRVAHGRARHDLGKDPRMFTENVDRQIVDAIESFSYRYKPQSLPNREVMRLLERKLAPVFRRIGLDPWVGTNDDFRGLSASYVTRSPEHGIRRRQMEMSVDSYKLRMCESRRMPWLAACVK